MPSSSRQLTSPSAPSSSGFGQHTPALTRHTSTLSGGVSSSSPPTDAIATPSADRYDAPSRGAAAALAKQGGNANVKPTRRSMRIRTSSGNGGGVGSGGVQQHQLDSSPQIGDMHGSGSFLDEIALHPSSSYSHPAPPPTHHLSASASSIRFAGASQPYQQQPHVARTPTHPHHHSHHHLQAAIQLDAPFSASACSSVRARPSFDDIMSRSAKRQKVAASAGGPTSGLEAVRQWAQEGSASSSDASSSSDDEDAGPMLQSLLTSHQRRASPGKKAGGLLHPSPAGLGAGAAEVSPSTAAATGRGVLDRYLSDRSSAAAAKADEVAPTAVVEMDVEEELTKPSPPKPSTSALPPIPASPAARRLSSRYPYPADTLLSPVPSRTRTASHNASVLFSPDVAKLLRSELDELEANEVAKGHHHGGGGLMGSPLRRGGGGVDRSSDIVVDDSYSSPYQRNASPFSSPQRRRTTSTTNTTRDIFSASSSQEHDSTTKRARWNTVLTAQQESGLASPTPSSASLSLSMRAPSFCDSSPAASDRGSVTSKKSAAVAAAASSSSSRHPFLSLDAGAAHPASAPDFLYGAGIPSSSPTSSQHSEYLPATRYHRSSPGPAFGSGSGTLKRSDSTATLLGAAADGSTTPVASTSSRIKRPLGRPAPGGNGPPYGQGDPHTKPTFSYAALIGQALFSTGEDKKMALADIYLWVMKYYPYFKKSDSGWQNSIRHNLSLNPCFVKTARTADNPGKGCLWAIKPGTEDQFVDGDFVRKSGQVSARKSRGKKGRAAAAAAAAAAAGGGSSPSKEDVKFDPQGLLRAAAAAAIASSPSSVGSPSLGPAPPLPTANSPPALARSHSTASIAGGSDRGVSPALSVASSSRPPLPATAMARRGSRVAFSPALSTVSARSVTPALASPLSPQVALAPAVEIDVEHEIKLEDEQQRVPTFSLPPHQQQQPHHHHHYQVQRPATAVGFARTESEPHLLTMPEAAAMTLRSHSSMGFVEDSSAEPPHTLPFVQQQQQQPPFYERQQNPFHTGAVPADVKPRLVAPPVIRTHSLPVLPSRPPTSPPASSSSLLAAHAAFGASSSISTSMSTSTSAPVPSHPHSRSTPPSATAFHEPLLSATMSPPTSVYYRLAGPYQPLSYSTSGPSGSGGGSGGGGGFGGHDRTPSANHRALALLASPEASGIMPGRPGERAAALLGVELGSKKNGGGGGGGRSSPPDSTPFLPAPQIFPSSSEKAGGTALRRSRTENDKEERGFGGNMLSPGALVHTQSPISSVRGGPRQPMSPVQNSSDKLEPFPDPEKKQQQQHPGGRAPGTRLLPAVNALATSSSSLHSDGLFDPFRSPPPSGFATPLATYATTAAGKAHLRSPSARLQAALSTPGGTKGRFPLGFSPSLAGAGASSVGGAWGVAHPSSSSRSSAAAGGAGWEDDEVGYHAVGAGVGGGFAWPSTPGMGIGREW